MKQFKIMSLFMLLFLVTIASAFAQFDVSSVSLGDDNQDRAEFTSVPVTITNNGPDALDEMSFEFISVNSKYQISGVLSANQTTVGGTVTFTVTGYVPLDLDAVDAKGVKKEFQIGTVKITAKNSSNDDYEKTVAVTMEAESMLDFGDKDITLGEDGTKSLRDGKTYDEIKRGDEIVLAFEVENKFDNSGECDDPDDYGDCDIDNVEIEFEPDDSDFNDESDEVDVSADDKESVSITFDVPDDINEDAYDFELWFTGRDDNGARHGAFLQFTLDVEVPKDEITIKDLYFTNANLDCDELSTVLKVMVENTGRRDQDEVVIEIESNRLDIDMLSYPPYIDLEEEDTVTKSFDVRLGSNVEPGTYDFIVRAFYDGDEETDMKSVPLTVRACVVVDDDDFDDDDVVVDDDSDTEFNIIEIPPSTPVIYPKDKEVSFFDSSSFILLMAGLFVVALLVFFVLLFAVLRR